MKAGRLDQRVAIVRTTRVADGQGGATTSETTVATVWAQVTPLRGNERDASRQVENPRDYRFTFRRSTVTAGILYSDVLRWNGADFNVRFIADAGGRPLHLTIEAQRGVAT